MNLGKRLTNLEKRSIPANSVTVLLRSGAKGTTSLDEVTEVFKTVDDRSKQWHKQGRAFPLPSELLGEIPNLHKLLEAERVERDLPSKFPLYPIWPVIESIRLMIARPPYEVSEDAEGEFMMRGTILGPLRISFVKPNHENLAA